MTQSYLFITDSELIEPTSCKAMEGVATLFTSESLTSDSINFIAPAPDAETTVVFQPDFSKNNRQKFQILQGFQCYFGS